MPTTRPQGSRSHAQSGSGASSACAREAVDDGWGSLEELARRSLAGNPGLAGSGAHDHRAQRFAGHPVRLSRSTPIAAASTAASTATPGPSHGHLGLSAGLDFETKIFVKHEAAAAAAAGAGASPAMSAADLARRQHRPLPAAGAAAADHAAGAGGAGRRPATRSASSPSRRWSPATSTCWRRWREQGLARVYVSVTTLDARDRPHPGAARRRPAPAAGRDPRAGRGRA